MGEEESAAVHRRGSLYARSKAVLLLLLAALVMVELRLRRPQGREGYRQQVPDRQHALVAVEVVLAHTWRRCEVLPGEVLSLLFERLVVTAKYVKSCRMMWTSSKLRQLAKQIKSEDI